MGESQISILKETIQNQNKTLIFSFSDDKSFTKLLSQCL